MYQRLLVGICLIVALWTPVINGVYPIAASPESATPSAGPACPVTKPTREPSGDPDSPGNVGTEVQTLVYPAGFIPVPGNWILPDGSLSMKFPFWWEPFLGSDLALTITSVAEPVETGRVIPLTDASKYASLSETFDGKWMFQAWLLIFPTEGCWQITADAGKSSLTFIAKVVAPTLRDSPPSTPTGDA